MYIKDMHIQYISIYIDEIWMGVMGWISESLAILSVLLVTWSWKSNIPSASSAVCLCLKLIQHWFRTAFCVWELFCITMVTKLQCQKYSTTSPVEIWDSNIRYNRFRGSSCKQNGSRDSISARHYGWIIPMNVRRTYDYELHGYNCWVGILITQAL